MSEASGSSGLCRVNPLTRPASRDTLAPKGARAVVRFFSCSVVSVGVGRTDMAKKLIRGRKTVFSSCGTLLASQPRGSPKNSAPKERHSLAHGAGHGLQVPSSHSPFSSPADTREGKARQSRGERFRTQSWEAVKKSDLTGLAHTGTCPGGVGRCAVLGVIASLADLKVCASQFLRTFWRPLRSCAPNGAVARSGSQSGTLSTSFPFTLLALLALFISLASCTKSEKPAAAEAAQKTFASPDDAGKALADAAKADDHNALAAIFGAGSKDLIFSGDETQDKLSFQNFAIAFQTMNRWRKQIDGSEVLYVGADNGPFPIPLKKNDAGQWYFDTAGGKEEILSRRIGDNELATIDVISAMVDAQAEYFSQAHDGVKQYAQRLISDEGKENGLYWKSPEGQPKSPLGPLAAFAAVTEGFTPEANKQQPFHGYFYRILTQQGKDAKGGAKNYIVNGHMTAGFGLVAYPEKYGDTGVMTFITDRGGVVYEKDVGKTTIEVAKAMNEFNPGSEWSPVQE